MAEFCSSCGTELFAGQQYCRRCGAPTRKFSTAEVPTQILPEARAGAPQPHEAARDTGPTETKPLTPRPTGDAGHEPRYAGFQPPAPPGGRAPLAPPAPLAGTSRRGWLWAVLVGSVVISAVVARQIAIHWAQKKVAATTPKVVKVNVPKVEIPDVALPPPLVLRGEEAAGEPLDEEGAEVTGDKTVITETFLLGEDGSVSIVNTAGNITVEGWDEEEAEVRITKRGGTAADRAAAQIIRSEADDRLTLRTAEGAANRLHEVRYEIKLPRSVRQLEITARDSNVRVANVAWIAAFSVRVARGDIELTNVGGAANTHTMKGHTRVVLSDADPADGQVFSGVNGDIELTLPRGANAQIKAQTVDGDIEADRGLKLDMQKRAAGWHAAGTVGRGGEPILVKTVSGDIRIKS